jgi:hypothetical protein
MLFGFFSTGILVLELNIFFEKVGTLYIKKRVVWSSHDI